MGVLLRDLGQLEGTPCTVFLDQVEGGFVGPVVGDDDLEVRLFLDAEPLEHQLQAVGLVVRGEDY